MDRQFKGRSAGNWLGKWVKGKGYEGQPPATERWKAETGEKHTGVAVELGGVEALGYLLDAVDRAVPVDSVRGQRLCRRQGRLGAVGTS